MRFISRLTLAACLTSTMLTHADTITWTGANGNGFFFQNGNWNVNDVVIKVGDLCTIDNHDLVINIAGKPTYIVGGGNGINGTLDLNNNSTLTVDGATDSFRMHVDGSTVIKNGTVTFKQGNGDFDFEGTWDNLDVTITSGGINVPDGTLALINGTTVDTQWCGDNNTTLDGGSILGLRGNGYALSYGLVNLLDLESRIVFTGGKTVAAVVADHLSGDVNDTSTAAPGRILVDGQGAVQGVNVYVYTDPDTGLTTVRRRGLITWTGANGNGFFFQNGNWDFDDVVVKVGDVASINNCDLVINIAGQPTYIIGGDNGINATLDLNNNSTLTVDGAADSFRMDVNGNAVIKNGTVTFANTTGNFDLQGTFDNVNGYSAYGTGLAGPLHMVNGTVFDTIWFHYGSAITSTLDGASTLTIREDSASTFGSGIIDFLDLDSKIVYSNAGRTVAEVTSQHVSNFRVNGAAAVVGGNLTIFTNDSGYTTVQAIEENDGTVSWTGGGDGVSLFQEANWDGAGGTLTGDYIKKDVGTTPYALVIDVAGDVGGGSGWGGTLDLGGVGSLSVTGSANYFRMNVVGNATLKNGTVTFANTTGNFDLQGTFDNMDGYTASGTDLAGPLHLVNGTVFDTRWFHYGSAITSTLDGASTLTIREDSAGTFGSGIIDFLDLDSKIVYSNAGRTVAEVTSQHVSNFRVNGAAAVVGGNLTIFTNDSGYTTVQATEWSPSGPTITVQSGTLAFGSKPITSTSSTESYTVSGSSLSENITVTAPSGYEVSVSSGSGYGSSLVLTQSAGSVASTTIYARFVPTAVQSYNGNISHASTGATTTNKAVTGTGLALPGGKNPTGANGTTALVGDTVTLNIQAWQSWQGNNRSYATVFGRYGNANLTSGTVEGAGRDPGSAADAMYAVTPRFTQAGNFYWAMRVTYGEGNDFWFDASRAGWTDLALSPPSSATLAITVSALEDPTGISAALDGSNPSGQINLSWSKWSNRHVLIVRSTDATFTAPTAGAGYAAGNSIGSDTVVYKGGGTSFNDTGVSSSSVYYYRLYSENWSYYSTGTTTGSLTTAGSPPPAPVAGSATMVRTNSFQANWAASAGAESYRLDVSSSSDFASNLVGYNNLTVNGTYATVSGLSPASTYYYRVRAVNANGTSSSSGTTQITTAQRSVLVAQSQSSTQVVFQAQQGAEYKKWYSDDGGVTWQLKETVVASSGTIPMKLDEGDSSNRIFVTKPSGDTPSASDADGAAAVITPTIRSGAGNFTLMSVPLGTDGDLQGGLGSQLAAGLSNGSKIYTMSSGASPSWTTYTLSGGTWTGSGDFQLNPGQGFYLENAGNENEIRIAGEISTSEVKTNSIASGFNLISVSQGRPVSASTAFETASPVGSYRSSSADQVAILQNDGSWRILYRRPDNTWYDTATGGTTTLELEPGQGYFYIRRGGATSVEF